MRVYLNPTLSTVSKRNDVMASLSARGKSRARAKNGDCHQFAPRHIPRNKVLSLKRIGWLYPIFRGLRFHHGLLSRASTVSW